MNKAETRKRQKGAYDKKRVIKSFSLLKGRDKHLIEYLETVDNVGDLVRDLLNEHLGRIRFLENMQRLKKESEKQGLKDSFSLLKEI